MLEITIPQRELYDEVEKEFVDQPEVTIVLEHSLVSLSKWESKWEIPFLDETTMSDEQTIDYIRCMTLTENIPNDVYNRLSNDNLTSVSDYINAKMTATWFSDTSKKGKKEIITAELIYYWMINLSIPFECQHWHLSRLLTLVRVCTEKNQPADKKMSKQELASRNRTLNAQRRAQMKTSG